MLCLQSDAGNLEGHGMPEPERPANRVLAVLCVFATVGTGP